MEEEVKRELELFFDNNKGKKLELIKNELKENIFADKRVDKIIYLIKLFKEEKKETIKLLKDNDDLELKNYISNLNEIIDYLNQSMIDLKNKQKTKQKQKTKKEKKHNNIDLIFDDKILKLVEKFEINYNLEKFSYNEIIELIKYYHNKKISIIYESNINKQTILEKELRRINIIFRQLIEYKNKFLINDKDDHFKLPISDEQIIKLDEELGINTINIIEKIKDNSVKYYDDIDLLIDIYSEYLKIEKTKKDKLVSKRRELLDNDMQNSSLLEECNDLIKNINIHMDILNNLSNYLKHYKKTKTNKKNGNSIFQDEVEINQVQQIIERQILLEKDISFYELKDRLFAIGHYIKNDGPIDLKLLQYTKTIFEECSEIVIDDEETLTGIHYVWDSIKYRLSNTQDLETRKILKDIRILFDYIVKTYKVDKQLDHDYLFDIVDYLLKSEDNYLYLKKIIKEIPYIINATHIVEENGKKQYEHIIIYILKKYIANYRKMLKDKKSDYVNLDYLKSVYMLFTKNYMMHLSSDEKKQIDKLLANFTHEVNVYLTSSKRQNAVKLDLKEMYTDKFYMNNKRFILEDINESRLETQMNNFKIAMDTSIKRKNRVDLTNENSFFIGGSPNAYSINQTENETILKIHVFDLYDLVVRNSELEKYLYNQTLQNEELDDFLISQINMSKNKVYPTITYEITFDKKGNYKRQNGHIDKFKIYQSKIEPKVYMTDFNLQYLRGGVILKSVIDLYKTSLIKNHGNYTNSFSMNDIKNYFEQILNQGITEYFKFNNLPFIYSGIKEKSEQEFIDLMNNISHILSRLNEKEFKTIYGVVESNVDEFHYSINEFNGIYQLSVQNPLNYVGLSIQRILHELVLENKHNEEEYKIALDKYKKEFKEIIMYLNYFNCYIDKDILKQNRGKIKQKEKILF